MDDMQMRGPALIRYFVVYFLCFQVNKIFNGVSLPYAKIWAQIFDEHCVENQVYI